MNCKARIKLEKLIVKKVIEAMADGGYSLIGVDDSEEWVSAVDTETALEAVFAVDTSFIYFQKNKKRYCVMVVLGNGEDVISDYTDSDEVDQIISGVCSNFLENFLEEALQKEDI